MTGHPSDAEAVMAARDRPASPAPAIPVIPLLSKVGHELRSPLTGIIGLTRVLLTKLGAGPVDSATLVRPLELIQASARRSLAAVERVVEAAKIDSGEVFCRPSAVDLRDALADAVGTMRATAEQRGLRLRVACPDHPVVVSTDQGLFVRVLVELIENAVKFTDDGEICVRVGDGSMESVTVDVIDEGPGVSEGERDRIFFPFERGEQAVRRNDEGVGMGLYLARRLAEVLGARLVLSGEMCPGATFTLTLPKPGVGAVADADAEARS